jgi:hypothetical protein
MAELLTVQDIHRLIEQDCQKMGFFAYDSLETEEIDLKINEQIYSFIEAVIDITRRNQPKIGVNEGFQANQVSLDSLRTIHLKDIPLTLDAFDDGMKFSLPDDYLHHIKTKLTIEYLCVDNDGKTVTKIITPPPSLRIGESQVIDNMRTSSFHKTVKESPLGEIVGNIVYIYTDSDFNLTNAKLDYIKRPAKVTYAKDIGGFYDHGNSVQCDLPPTALYMIINMTVVKILKVIETQQQKIVNLEN